MSLMEQFANPDLMHQLSFSDKLAGAGITTLMGMGTTFVVLILLWGIIAVITKVMSKATGRQEAQAMAAASGGAVSASAEPATAATSEPVSSATPTAVVTGGGEGAGETVDDGALAAVIAAAIAAYEGGVSEPELIVKRIRRISGSSTVWANAGRNETIDSRKM